MKKWEIWKFLKNVKIFEKFGSILKKLPQKIRYFNCSSFALTQILGEGGYARTNTPLYIYRF